MKKPKKSAARHPRRRARDGSGAKAAPRRRAARKAEGGPATPRRGASRRASQPVRSVRGQAAVDRRIRQALFSAWRAAAGKKAEDTVALDVRGLAGFTDYFLITQGANARQVEAITDAIEQAVQRGGGPRLAHREGGAEAEWRVLDYLDFVVHIFSAASRRFYGLERLWQKAPRLSPPAGRRPAEA